MQHETSNPQINMSKIPMGAGVGGALSALGLVLIILTGIPALWYMVPVAIAVGCGVALVLHFIRHKTPGAPWILPLAQKK